MTSLKDIRSQFLEFFAARDHHIAPSAPLVPHNDPTLMFVNAGMVPFKNIFTGAETRDYKRAASSQKCVRAGGKHNDLDNVGYTARHHTFFEMLGNFSFGDYFKEEAIASAWTLVHKEFGLAADRLTVTIYHTDDEAFDLWRKISGLPEARIIRIPTNDNFWSMGDTGPCGPCSEIFYDHGDHIPGGPPGSPDEDGDRFVEIWNLVFMQFERFADGSEVNLPKPSIDTGMGLERIAAVMQGVHDNYDVDLFQTLINACVDLTGRPAVGDDAPAHRVIADHLRATSFLMADGVAPSNEGRGYVLRRIMRRAMRYAHSLGARDPLLAQLAPVLVREMGGAFPELGRAQTLIIETLRSEEEKFRSLLDRGLKLLADETASLADGAPLPGDAAFKLYDTFGFPLDLTQDALRREGREVDTAGFDAAMQAQKKAARAAWAGSGDAADDSVWFDLRAEHGASEFLGYIHDDAEGVAQAIVKDGAVVDEAREGDAVEIIVNQTPFYAESGGQIGDAGCITTDNGAEIVISDVKKRAGVLHGHIGTVKKGTLKKGENVHLTIDIPRRNRIRSNHSVTHLAHAALREVLGDHVSQKGSLVAPDRMRFDITNPKPISADEVAEVERRVNAVIRQNGPVETRIMSYDDAVDSGAIALFGEKYDDDVRVLTMGHALDGSDNPYSVELCGGTHVKRVGDIALFKIVSESAVSAGVRRIECMTGEAARLYLEEQAMLARRASDALKTTLDDLPVRIETLVAERRKLERDLAQAKKELALGGGGAKPADEVIDVGGVKFMGKVLNGVAAKDLRGLVDQAKSAMGSGVAAFIGVNDGKAALAVGVTDDLKDTLSAVDLVRAGAEAVGGKGGGGRPDMAQAGGPDGARAAEAIKSIEQAISA
ncbi:alanine--tRNA ligase [Hyphococcus sp.]|uniref:alanine--tRNA ligase n=1 Tax=Hyphococcus sp. TaxID=2038636 RepID=UPI003CCBB071